MPSPCRDAPYVTPSFASERTRFLRSSYTARRAGKSSWWHRDARIYDKLSFISFPVNMILPSDSARFSWRVQHFYALLALKMFNERKA